MPGTGIVSIAGYLPRSRMSRKAIADAVKWANPALAGLGKGHRTACTPDEDSITMAVEAGRSCLAASGGAIPEILQFASTTAPFADRSNAILASEALNLPSALRCADFGGFLGAGIGAVIDALDRSGTSLTVAADRRAALPGSALEMSVGHGAAAVLTGSNNPIAICLATHVNAEDFVDHYRAAGSETDYALEERWVRDEGQMKIVPPAIAAILDKAGIAAAQIDHVLLAGTSAAAGRQIAKACGFSEVRLADALDGQCGNTGAPHPLLMLANTLEQAKPGAKILVASFAQGTQIMLLETSEAISGWRPHETVRSQLASGSEEENYVRFLSHSDQLTIDWGMRAERDNRTALSAFNRHRKTVTGFIGGKCSACGTKQFPRGPACVNPQCREFSTLEDEPFKDKIGRIKSFTEDWLAISANPPLMYGNVAFDDGGVILMEFTDFAPGELKVGLPVRFVFRIKDKDPKRNFRRYFWKAAPARNAEKR
ncbi:MAG: OB-fold domain-containing protein [Blastomonas sp.]